MAGLLLSISDKFLFIAALSIKSSVNSKTCGASLFFRARYHFIFSFNELFFLWQTYCSACGREFFARGFWVCRGVFHSACVKMAAFYAVLA
ncbi:hypothetical protein ACI01G_001263 [Cronobacter sakazakii]